MCTSCLHQQLNFSHSAVLIQRNLGLTDTHMEVYLIPPSSNWTSIILLFWFILMLSSIKGNRKHFDIFNSLSFDECSFLDNVLLHLSLSAVRHHVSGQSDVRCPAEIHLPAFSYDLLTADPRLFGISLQDFTVLRVSDPRLWFWNLNFWKFNELLNILTQLDFVHNASLRKSCVRWGYQVAML